MGWAKFQGRVGWEKQSWQGRVELIELANDKYC